MSPRLSRISVLEQVPLFEGGDVRRTLGDLVRLGRGLEESGYHRLWLAEHHSTGSFLSSAPDLHMMHILDATDRIRVGSGGVMAMHYGSLQMAERFATLATLHPGRVDMGLGRAPGGDMRAAAALNQGRVIDPDAINALIEETVATSFPPPTPTPLSRSAPSRTRCRRSGSWAPRASRPPGPASTTSTTPTPSSSPVVSRSRA